MLGAMDLGIADDGERASDEQAAQVAVTSFTKPMREFPRLCRGGSKSLTSTAVINGPRTVNLKHIGGDSVIADEFVQGNKCIAFQSR